jgi:hypothetical protein
MIECLLCKCKTLNSNPSFTTTTKKQDSFLKDRIRLVISKEHVEMVSGI